MVHRSTLYRRRKKLEKVLRRNKRQKTLSTNEDEHSASNMVQSTVSGAHHVTNDVDNEYIDIDDEDQVESNGCIYRQQNSKPTEKEMATMLILLKARHKLSNICVKDICYLLRVLKVSNVPKDYNRIAYIFRSASSSSNKSTTMNICSECSQQSINSDYCDNVQCTEHDYFRTSPMQFVYMQILPQIRAILARTKYLNFERQEQQNYEVHAKKDISDGDAYSRILPEQKQNKFITLIMNVDGVSVSKSSQSSLWIISLVINELKRKERFKMKNVIVAGVSSSKNKPSRDQMFTMLSPIVEELKQLEYGRYFDLTFSHHNFEPVRVFLLAACLDKPAQALVQNLNEPIAAYGCARCEIMGETVLVDDQSKHKIRVFPLLPPSSVQPRLRSNSTHDEIIDMNYKDTALNKEELRNLMRGHVGPCVLRTLKYFDVGSSFLSDTLHNLYHGVMKRLVDLWFNRKYRRRPWSCCDKITKANDYLSQYKYPTNMVRVPRSIVKYHLFKGNELRSLLLFGFMAFKIVLSPKYYNHFLLLVFAAHLIEARSVCREEVALINNLLDRFLRLFPTLYTSRHNVQCVHSLQHFAASVSECGCSSNYSTFNFESFLGILTGSIHGTRRHGIEISNNIHVLRAACIEAENPNFNYSLRGFLDSLQRDGRSCSFNHRAESNSAHVRIQDRDKDPIKLQQIKESINNANIDLFKSCYIGSKRVTTTSYNDKSFSNDSCILFTISGKLKVGFIRSIIRINRTNQNSFIYQVVVATIDSYLHINFNRQNVACKNVMLGNINCNSTILFIKSENIIERLIHVFDKSSKQYIFFRFPNLLESS